ncbi:unnamed product [Ostreococcus tauri]|uniref:Unnamed product n=1 Tax=Ostreococcus tauri TaxID=70448 RepID=A0A090M3D7_OSTTA|nr:unnamed product [Ostreococcus tauri]CEF98745.1 unnamed product [Ostreococcus tauri]|eukprot:XP_022839442.1 unnamed product [Ostreococcus tauri]
MSRVAAPRIGLKPPTTSRPSSARGIVALRAKTTHLEPEQTNTDVSFIQTTASPWIPRSPLSDDTTPTQRSAFVIGFVLGAPLALYKIAYDVRRQNVAERRRAAAAADRTRVSSALDGRRDGRLRAESVGRIGRRAEVRAQRNVTDIPIASNKPREVKMAKKGVAPKTAVATPTSKPKPAPVKKVRGKPVKITLATEAVVPEGYSLSVVGDDEAIAKPVALKRVGQNRWQVVLEVGSGELRYSYVAVIGDTMTKDVKGERVRQVPTSESTLIVETEAPSFS